MVLWDYIVVGGGLAGSVISNRLSEQTPRPRILVIEGGINANDREDIVWVNSTNGQGGDFDWSYQSVPQVNLDNRVIPSNSGKGLGGGTLINGGMFRTTTSKRFHG
jgi:choline dehydrogenase-like flavoprotein